MPVLGAAQERGILRAHLLDPDELVSALAKVTSRNPKED
jgi:hypothetical protein